MSTTATNSLPENASLFEYPDTDLAHLVDDQDNPTEVTIFSPESDDPTTSWITIDIDATVSIYALQ